MPVVLLHSDPGMPDRTAALLGGQSEALRGRLEAGLSALLQLGAERTVVCCLTMHAVVPDIAAELRRDLLSLVDVALAAVAQRGVPYLLLCTDGARRTRVFHDHPAWASAAEHV